MVSKSELIDLIAEKYKAAPQYLWQKYPDYAVFKHENGKWFALIMGVSAATFGIKENGKVDVIDIKMDADLADILRAKSYFFPGYHMNKRTWTTIILKDIEMKELEPLLEESYQTTLNK
uniref:MmcQ/YjbR family DNA-binding protein n=1 Tax=Companilactobacillus formosensis TaxID=1617889 RepID=A0A2P4R4N2_9LACO